MRTALTDIAPWRVAAAGVAGLAGVGLSAQIWRALLGGLGVTLSYPAASRVFFVGQLGKYLPGSVWPVVAQMELGRELGIVRRTSVTAVALFLWVHLCTGVVVASAVLPFSGLLTGAPVVGDIGGLLAVGVPLGVALLLPGVLRGGVTLLLRLTRRAPLAELPGGRAVAVAAGWAAVMWLAYGAHLWLLTGGLGPDGTGLAGMTGVFAAAWSVGFAFLVAPAGAGARELVLLALLPLSPGAGLAVAVLSRALLTAADGLWGSLGAAAAHRRA